MAYDFINNLNLIGFILLFIAFVLIDLLSFHHCHKYFGLVPAIISNPFMILISALAESVIIKNHPQPINPLTNIALFVFIYAGLSLTLIISVFALRLIDHLLELWKESLLR